MATSKRLSQSKFAPKVVEFLNIAYKDYIAARVLIHAGLLSQAAVLASTAVEKYLKAIIAFRGNEAKGHLSKKHVNSAVNYDRRLSEALNHSFLELLQRAYEIRYLDTLPNEFNLVIADREFLAELDFTALMIQESFGLQQNGQDVEFTYHADKKAQNPHLMYNNFMLRGTTKQSYISAEPQLVYELRNCALRGLLEVTYRSQSRESDGDFLREGFKDVSGTGMQYQMSLAPVVRAEGEKITLDEVSGSSSHEF